MISLQEKFSAQEGELRAIRAQPRVETGQATNNLEIERLRHQFNKMEEDVNSGEAQTRIFVQDELDKLSRMHERELGVRTSRMLTWDNVGDLERVIKESVELAAHNSMGAQQPHYMPPSDTTRQKIQKIGWGRERTGRERLSPY